MLANNGQEQATQNERILKATQQGTAPNSTEPEAESDICDCLVVLM